MENKLMDYHIVDIELVGGIDQTLPIEKAQISVLKKVDELVVEAVEQGKPEMIFKAMRSLLGVGRVSGLALAKLVYLSKFQWKNFKRREDFYDAAEEEIGRKKVTIQRYYRVWEMLVEKDIPREYTEKLQLHPMKSLIPMAQMLEQGYEVESHQWKKLAEAPDVNTVNKIVREIKGKPAKADSLQITWDESNQELSMWKNGTPHKVYMTYDENDEVILAGLKRLFQGKVMEQ